jgi:hypothetical protein
MEDPWLELHASVQMELNMKLGIKGMKRRVGEDG